MELVKNVPIKAVVGRGRGRLNFKAGILRIWASDSLQWSVHFDRAAGWNLPPEEMKKIDILHMQGMDGVIYSGKAIVEMYSGISDGHGYKFDEIYLVGSGSLITKEDEGIYTQII